MKNKLILKGSLHGTKQIKKYDNPDILYSKVDGMIFQKNDFTISKNKDNSFYLYHSYVSFDEKFNKINSSRWYHTNYVLNSKSINDKNKTLTIILKDVNWENLKTGKQTIKNVKIILYLSPNGLEKILKYL